jgi:UDP-3-O-[3-hydroxymyristoyl] glucosamine N-acyltransferase
MPRTEKLSDLANWLDGQLKGDPEVLISGAAPFDAATSDQITLAGGPAYLKRIHETRAGAVIVPRNFGQTDRNLIQVELPQVAFAKVLQRFFPPDHPYRSIDASAIIGQGVVLGEKVAIGPYVVIGENACLGQRVMLYPHVVIGRNAVIGDDVVIYPNVFIGDRCRIGSRVIIHAGSVIGSDGFGFAPDGRTYHKIPHTGIVQIDDDVEIGANNAIDRATFGKTWIQKGVKTDNLVHIAHNVEVGENTVIVAQVGISGSVTMGHNCILAGQAGIAGHLTLGDNVTVGPQSGVGKSIPNGEIMTGSPVMAHKTWLKVQRVLPMLPDLKKKIAELEKKMELLK